MTGRGLDQILPHPSDPTHQEGAPDMFTKRMKLFHLVGIPIFIDLSWFIVVLLITWTLATGMFPQFYKGLAEATYWWMGLAGAIGLFVSILAHELGHSVVARRCNMPIQGITLFIFGGVAEMSQEPPSPRVEFLVAIAGPIVSVLIAIACYVTGVLGEARLATSVVGVLWYLGMVNGVVVAFNLIPAFPLDGGRVLRSVLWHVKGNLRWATRISSSLGSGFGLLLMLFGVLSVLSGNVIGGMWQFLIGMFLRGAAQTSYQQVLIRRALEGEHVGRFMRSEVVTVSPATTVEKLVEDYIYKHHHKMFPVIDEGQLMGCVTTRDVQQVPRGEWMQRTVAEIIEPCTEENTIDRDADAMEALSSMSRIGTSRLIVVRDGHLEGVVSLKDMLEFISLKVELEEGVAV